MFDFPQLQTPRLLLREITEDDADALFRIHSNAQHMAWFGNDPLTDLDEARKMVAMFASWRQLPNPGTRWGLELKDQPGLIGTCGLFAWNRDWKKCTLGYELAPEFTGKGLMREALASAFAWGFEQMQLNRIEAQVHESNLNSIALLSAFGFTQEGLLREGAFWGNSHHDLLQYSLLSREWREQARAS
jgi:ribosomal-protein-alanine N-acetyltransferase